MFPQFGATAESLTKASTMVFRIGTDAHLYDDPEDVNIAPLLDSKFDSEKCEALKRLLALIAQGFDVSNFFPQVVKNVASQSLEVKKLVYLYLLHYAEKRPNEALLSINCFQKDLGDPNPLVRAWALRTMAGIRLHAIAPLVLVALGKCARDPSVYVRKCAANALPKLHDLRLEGHKAAIEEIVGILLNDNSPGVVGAAAAAFSSVCPNNLLFIGRSYRRLCKTLPDVEEWGQIVLIGLLLRYTIARHGLVKESIMMCLCSSNVHDCEKEDVVTNHNVVEENNNYKGSEIYHSELADRVLRSYLEGPDKYLSRSNSKDRDSIGLDAFSFTSAKDNDDVKILLQCTVPLLWSSNSAVVLAAAGVHWIMAPKDEVGRIVKPLLFLLRASNSSKYVVLFNIHVFAKAIPYLFSPHYEDFFINCKDSYQIKALKLEILSSIATESSIYFIFQEFQDYIKDPDRRFAADTVAAIGLCARRLPKVANKCLEGLLSLTSMKFLTSNVSLDGEALVVTQAIISIRAIIELDPPSHEKVIIQLIRSLDSLKVPKARALIIWMVGEYCSIGDIIPRMMSTVIKYLAWCFTSEENDSKLQILNAVVKVLLRAEAGDLWIVRRVLSYVLELAKYDMNYDVRDRARILKNILSFHIASECLIEDAECPPVNNEAQHILVEGIFGGQTKLDFSQSSNYRFYLPGSLSQIVFHAAPGYEPLPEPCSLINNEGGCCLNDILGRNVSRESGSQSASNEIDVIGSESGSLDEESTSAYSLQESDSSVGSQSDESRLTSTGDQNTIPLIHFSEVGTSCDQHEASELGDDFGELMSNSALESWLDDNPDSSYHLNKPSNSRSSTLRINIGDVAGRAKHKSYTLFDSANGNGLRVNYVFSSELSSISPLLVCVEIFFQNFSAEPISKLFLVEEECNRNTESSPDQASEMSESPGTSSDDVPTLFPMEVIGNLEPGQSAKRTIQVRFHHHLLPLKLVLCYNDRKIGVKLRPDIGYFIKPLPMDMEMFMQKESQLPGMFEYMRSCTFVDHLGVLNEDKDDNWKKKDRFVVICESLALKMLSNANVFLVSVDMPVSSNLDDTVGCCLRFCGEILNNSVPCLISITVDGKCLEPLNVSVKVNCEGTVFGLNLLNRIVNFLAEPSG